MLSQHLSLGRHLPLRGTHGGGVMGGRHAGACVAGDAAFVCDGADTEALDVGGMGDWHLLLRQASVGRQHFCHGMQKSPSGMREAVEVDVVDVVIIVLVGLVAGDVVYERLQVEIERGERTQTYWT